MTKTKITKSTSGSENQTKSSENELNGSKPRDPLVELEALLDAGIDDDERTSNVFFLPALAQASSPKPSLMPKVPDTWAMRIVAAVIGLGAFGAAIKQLIELMVK